MVGGERIPQMAMETHNAHPFHYDGNPTFAKALSYKDVPILEIEQVQRDKLKRLPGTHFAK